MAMFSIRRAQPCDSKILTGIAVRSEAHWGYDSAFMDAFMDIYKVTEGFIAQNPTFLVEENASTLGFYALVPEKTSLFLEYIYLEYMYIEPSLIGKGLGRVLWDHMTAYCRQRKFTEIHLVCGPQPKAFYLKMGAVEIGEVDSLVTPGRKISKLAYRTEQGIGIHDPSHRQ